jgi:uncharacterized protein YndB with AHSA1/START domain
MQADARERRRKEIPPAKTPKHRTRDTHGEPQRRLVFTDALGPLYRPKAEAFMIAEITMEATAGGTRYRALVRHKSAEERKKHEDMGFFQGWGTCLVQLEELALKIRPRLFN